MIAREERRRAEDQVGARAHPAVHGAAFDATAVGPAPAYVVHVRQDVRDSLTGAPAAAGPGVSSSDEMTTLPSSAPRVSRLLLHD